MTDGAQGESPANWLQCYLVEAVRKGLCTKYGCTTCGAMEFRRGLIDELTRARGQQGWVWLDRRTAVELASALARVEPIERDPSRFEDAVRFVLTHLWDVVPGPDLESILAESWAGALLERMKVHHQAEVEAR